MVNPKITSNSLVEGDSYPLTKLYPESVIVKFYKFVKQEELNDLEYDVSMIEVIDEYIDKFSPRWIYSPILRSNPESRYIVFLIHYFDRNPGMQLLINSLLSASTLLRIESLKISFKLGC